MSNSRDSKALDLQDLLLRFVRLRFGVALDPAELQSVVEAELFSPRELMLGLESGLVTSREVAQLLCDRVYFLAEKSTGVRSSIEEWRGLEEQVVELLGVQS
jgi:hypothetical protein